MAHAVRTPDAIELAHRLVAWHDAMVIHRRRAGHRRGPTCGHDCPHEQAVTLWHEAVDVFGERAQQFGFLRSHGGRSRRPMTPRVSELRA